MNEEPPLQDGSDVARQLKSDRNPRSPRDSGLDGEDDPIPACAGVHPLANGRWMIGRSTWKVRSSGEPADRELPRKEVIQPHLPVRLPCYDFVPITNPTFDGCLLAVGPPASGVIGFHDVTGGVYKAREHIHRSVLTCGY